MLALAQTAGLGEEEKCFGDVEAAATFLLQVLLYLVGFIGFIGFRL